MLVRALDAVQSDDYSRGLKCFQSLVYTLGVGRTEASLEQPFQEFNEKARQPLSRNVGIYFVATVVISLVGMAVACRVRA